MKKKIIPLLISVFLVLQCLTYNMLSPVSNKLEAEISLLNATKISIMDTFIKDTIRAEQRKILNSIRQSWVQYVTLNPDVELLLKKDGKYVYTNNHNQVVLFDNETMKIKKDSNSYYSVYWKATDELIIAHARPQWNIDAVQEVLSVVATPVKLFDTNSEIIAFDIYTGDVFLNTTGRNVSNALSYLMEKTDTQRNTGLVSLHYDESDMLIEKANDFSMYPLGLHDRLFIEKVILPYESIGVEGLDMQIGISIGVRESELMKPYNSVINKYNESIAQLDKLTISIRLFPKLIILCSVAIMFLCLFYTRYIWSEALKKKRE